MGRRPPGPGFRTTGRGNEPSRARQKILRGARSLAKLSMMSARSFQTDESRGRREQLPPAAVAAALVALWLIAAAPAYAWGPTAHRLVNRWAVDTLPPEIRAFFQANREFLIEHANDPDEAMKKDKHERELHYIYLDKYGIFPYLKLPHLFDKAVEQYGSGHIHRDGMLPWQVGKISLRLTEAFRTQNWEEAKVEAALLGHYVADAHDPLHTTQNYDGQLTGQTGLADRFEIRLVDKFSSFFMFARRDATKIADPTEHAFDMVLETNTWADHVILADREALIGLPDYNEDYYDRFYSRVGSVVVRELSSAANDTGSYWYTAWLNAGRPELPH
jgi:hypothetical protein